MSNGKRYTQPTIFINGAAAGLTAHAPDWSIAYSIAWCVFVHTDIYPSHEDSVIMVYLVLQG